jgi:hypothetical protein
MKQLFFIISLLIVSPAFSQTLPAYVPADGIMAWYPFSGNANDGTGNGFDGTVNGATLAADRFGNTNSAYQFDGSSTSISTNLAGPSGNAARTVACWFKYGAFPNACNTQGVLAGYGANSELCGQTSKNFSLEINNDVGGPTGWVDGVCIADYQNLDTLDTGWHFMAATYDTSFGDFFNIKLYVDGEYKSTSHMQFGPSSVVNTDTLSKLLIGKGHYSCKRFFNGEIDDIGVWNRALQVNELYDLYRGAPYASTDSLLVYVDNLCSNMQFTVSPAHYTPGMTVKTWFGDGQVHIDSFSTASQLAVIEHIYAYSGNYTIKHVIYRNAIATDSISYSYNYQFCRILPMRFYADTNGDCNYDPMTEPLIFQPTTLEVDSAGIPIDTVSATSGLDYYAYGAVGTIYDFKAIEVVPGAVLSCPANGIVTDTLQLANNPVKNVGLQCSGTPGYDLQLYATGIVGSHRFAGMVIATNTYCTPIMGTLTMHMTPHYTSQQAFFPNPASIVGNAVTWNIANLSSTLSNPAIVYAHMEGAGTIGDTVQTIYEIDPMIGDMNPSDNIIIHDDTITGSYDPNYIAVTPRGCLQPGVTKLTYAIHFENTGNDTAFNIYVLDTLPDYVDVKSLRMLTASAAMNISILKPSGYTVVKFDFPNINLLDSSHHGQCEGMLMYSINVKAGLPDGTYIPNSAGIYFDDNEVVLTNAVSNRIGCPTSVTNVSRENGIDIYPNPAYTEFTIRADNSLYHTATLSNTLGGVISQQALQSRQTIIDVHGLPAGVYYITLTGNKGNVVRKIVKM